MIGDYRYKGEGVQVADICLGRVRDLTCLRKSGEFGVDVRGAVATVS